MLIPYHFKHYEINGNLIYRWEANKKMLNLLKQGTTLIVDRYSYSGAAFSSAKGINSKS